MSTNPHSQRVRIVGSVKRQEKKQHVSAAKEPNDCLLRLSHVAHAILIGGEVAGKLRPVTLGEAVQLFFGAWFPVISHVFNIILIII